MALPRRLRIGHIAYKVRVDATACAEADSDGLWDIDDQAICLRPGLPPDHQRAVLLHETLHACFHAAGLETADDVEERIVTGLTGPLLNTLRDHPAFVAYLTQGA